MRVSAQTFPSRGPLIFGAITSGRNGGGFSAAYSWSRANQPFLLTIWEFVDSL
jgi:hypothetical protein